MDPTKRAYLELHIAVFLWGFTAILGDLIQLSAIVLVWWRVLITSLGLLSFIRGITLFKTLPRKHLLQYAGIGVLIAIHWIAFYGSIKLANASIALVCMATTSFSTSFLEPIMLRTTFRWYEFLLGLLIIPGMYLVVDATSITMMPGIWVGLLSALLASIFAIFNKKYIHQAAPMSITFIELGSSWLFISLLLPFFFYLNPEAVFVPLTSNDWFYLLVLSILCTALPYVLSLRSLRHLSAFASNLIVNMEPVYGIGLAWVLLNESEDLSPHFYWGVLLILMAVFSYPLIRKIRRPA